MRTLAVRVPTLPAVVQITALGKATIFDAASLAYAVLQLIDAGALTLDTPLPAMCQTMRFSYSGEGYLWVRSNAAPPSSPQQRLQRHVNNAGTTPWDAGAAMLLALEALPDKAASIERPPVPEVAYQLDRALRASRERAVLAGHGEPGVEPGRGSHSHGFRRQHGARLGGDVLRVKSLLGYAHKLGYTRFNAGATMKVRSDVRSRRATLAKRIITPTQVSLLIRAARTRRDRVLLQVGYAGGLRVSELVSLTWSDVREREEGRVQLSVTGKGGVVRQVLLPAIVSRAVLALRGDAAANDPLFLSREGGGRLTVRAVRGMVKRAAARAGIDEETASRISPHWLRHAHASHAIDGGASLPEVRDTLGHGNIATTSGYLHARPGSSSGLRLDEGVFLR